MTQLQAANATLASRERRDWFLAGAGAVLIGVLLGLLLPRLRAGRRRSWDRL